MSNYNQLKITYQGGQETAITLTSSTIQYFEYQRQNIIAVEVPEIVETIGEYAFCDNNGLSSIVLNEGLQTIGNQAFQHGVYTAVTIPSTVTSIGENSFNMADEQYDDEHPFTVTCLAATPPTLDDSEGITFGLMRYLQAIYVPAESVDAYKAAFNWANYASKIQAIPEPEPPKPVYRYIQSFETAADWYSAYADNKLGAPSVVYLEDEQRIVWNEVPEPPAPDYSAMPLTFEILSAGTISATTGMSLEYSLNDGEWTTYADAEINLQQGDILKLRGNNETAPEIGGTAYYNAYGNAYSVLSATGFENITALTVTFACYHMFAGTNIVSAKNLALPATTLAETCYGSMFHGCTGLTTAPVLPATTLATSCYNNMFAGCTSLTTPPELPATTLANSCYGGMFNSCTSLTTAPDLPATTLAAYCYSTMFSYCSSLTTAPDLPATTLANYCYSSMFRDCTSLATAPDFPATTLASNCYASMFQGCTSLTTAPELSATTLAQYCYASMFRDCTNLTSAPMLPETTLVKNCYNGMFQGCTSLVNAPVLPATTLVNSCYVNMFRDCSSLSYIKCLAADISVSNISNWVRSVASTGTFVKNPNMTSWPTGNNGIPTGWTVIDATI